MRSGRRREFERRGVGELAQGVSEGGLLDLPCAAPGFVADDTEWSVCNEY